MELVCSLTVLGDLPVLQASGEIDLLGAAGRAREHGGDLLLVCNSERLRSRFSLTGLDRAMVVQARVALPRHHAGERNGTPDRRDQKSS